MTDFDQPEAEIDRRPLTVRAAFRQVENRKAYATIVIETERQTTLKFANGRMLTTDDEGRSINLIEAIAAGLIEDCPCWVDPLWDTPDVDSRPSAPIAEAFAAAVRLAAASATLGFTGDSMTEQIIATSMIGTTDPSSEKKKDGNDRESPETQSQRTMEADRMRADFFERRSNRLVTAPQSHGIAPMHPGSAQSRPAYLDRRSDQNADQAPADPAPKPSSSGPAEGRGVQARAAKGPAEGRSAKNRPVKDRVGEDQAEEHQAAEKRSGKEPDSGAATADQGEAPQRRSALRSLIRNLRS